MSPTPASDELRRALERAQDVRRAVEELTRRGREDVL